MTHPKQTSRRPRRIDWQAALTGVGLALLFAALWALIQFSSPNLAGNDGYFHIRFAQVMRQEGLRPPFPWLPLTILNPASYYDHHFLYHVLLMPFTLGDLRLGAKWAGVLFPTLAFLMGWLVLRGQNVPYAALWALGFFAMSEAFLYRLSMTRVQAVSLLMLLGMLHVTLKGRPVWLLPLAFVYTWLYDAFPLWLAMAGLIVAVRWLFERRLDLRPLLYSGLGVGLGLLINPYFPHNVIFIYQHFLPKVVDITGSTTNVGNEWYPYETWSLVKNSGPMLLALAAGALALGLHQGRMSTATAIFFFVALFFVALLFKSRRFIEYTPAFVLLFCAVAWKPVLAQWQARYPGRAGRLLPLGLALLLAPALGVTVRQAHTNALESSSYLRFAGASAWLQANTPPGSRLFQTDWDDFSQLFFYNTHNTYLLGLDPTYMQQHDPALYDQWRDLTQGWGNLGPAIRDQFGAAYAITDPEHYGFIDKAALDPYLKQVYADEFTVIYEVLAEPDPEKKGWYGSFEQQTVDSSR